MARLYLLICIVGLLQGCASGTYGYSDHEWQSLSPEERAQVIAEVEQNIQQHQQAIHNKELTSQSLNTVFGTRSNDYSAWPGSVRRSLNSGFGGYH